MPDLSPAAFTLILSLAVLLAATVMPRLPRRPDQVPMMPWNFILIAAILGAAVAASHLLGLGGSR